MIGNILDNTTELYMIKYIFGEIFSSGGATLCKNPSDQTVPDLPFPILPDRILQKIHLDRLCVWLWYVIHLIYLKFLRVRMYVLLNVRETCLFVIDDEVKYCFESQKPGSCRLFYQ